MSANTKIEWCDHTFNPWIGCQKVSPACLHCYAEKSTPVRVLRAKGVETWGVHAPRHRTSAATWKGMRDWNAAHDAFHALHGRRQRVFCASLADVFDNAVHIAWFTEFLDLCRLTPHLDKLLLTKRIGLVERRLAEALEYASEVMLNPLLANWIVTWLDGDPPPDIWLGTTIVNQPEADRDITKLQAAPARVRFLSMEPLLGPVDLGLCNCDGGSRPGPGGVGGVTCTRCGGTGGPLVDWVIVGGESGPGARPMHPDWARSLRDQCAAACVPFFFKQWGEWSAHPVDPEGCSAHLCCIDLQGRECALSRGETAHAKDEGWWFLPPWPGRGTWGPDGIPDGVVEVRHTGKKAAGRHLDGRTHDEFPS